MESNWRWGVYKYGLANWSVGEVWEPLELAARVLETNWVLAKPFTTPEPHYWLLIESTPDLAPTIIGYYYHGDDEAYPGPFDVEPDQT